MSDYHTQKIHLSNGEIEDVILIIVVFASAFAMSSIGRDADAPSGVALKVDHRTARNLLPILEELHQSLFGGVCQLDQEQRLIPRRGRR